ncbi:nuclear transcription factor Y subunit B-1-like [Papaver somniferum]|uniref:nuclear transcription factor Y subunit B-1-like n=1 Tax=Papaver somniferum TaxID=3469 RepID=UPI000E6FD87A|nr:nuclear transcription factor Y subunit B-1-like [Papaver somniferum]
MVDNNVPGSSSNHGYEVHQHKYKDSTNIGFAPGAGSGNSLGDENYIKEQDRLLPIANVGRIMKHILPPNAKISKEAKETMQECVSEFISFVTGEASDKCHKEKRKTVNGDDVCFALSTLGFDNFVEPLKLYLNKYRELDGDKANSQVNKSAADDRDYDTTMFRSDQPTNNQSSASPSLRFNITERNNHSNSRPF